MIVVVQSLYYTIYNIAFWEINGSWDSVFGETMPFGTSTSFAWLNHEICEMRGKTGRFGTRRLSIKVAMWNWGTISSDLVTRHT